MKIILKILAIGDVTSPKGIEHLKERLWKIRKERSVDFCVVNAENASFITGISQESAQLLLRSGADAITGGNHTMQNVRSLAFMDEIKELLRPINYGDGAIGRGYAILEANGYRILVINAMGNIHIDPVLDSPFPFIDRVLKAEEGRYDFSILDIHAEATGEKLAIAHAYDGKINAIFGTHTHVQTADAQILPNGTAYITDVGMCGESGGILGMDPSVVVERMRTRIPVKFRAAEGTPIANAVLFTIDEKSKKATSIEAFNF